MTLVATLLALLVACGLLLIVSWRAALARMPQSPDRGAPTLTQWLIGFVTNFLDTLGIGSFATTTTLYRLMRIVPDELIPGTMVVGHALGGVTQGLFFISVIDVDPWQMTALIVTCVIGGWLGAGVVSSLPRRAVQLGMGTALLLAIIFMLFGMFGLFPTGGTARSLSAGAFGFALVMNFLLGALVTLGIGNYAPSLIMFSLLGMDPRAAFPIMAGSAGFVATIAGVRFVGTGRFHPSAALGLALGGVPGVIIAAWLVKSLPLDTLRWLVLAVVAYAAVTLLRAATRHDAPPAPRPSAS